MREFKTYFKEDIPKKVKKTQADYARDLRNRANKKKLSKIKKNQPEMDKFYLAVHKRFDYTCQETGIRLAYDNKQAAHLLPKSKYPDLKFDLRNSLLLSWNIHNIIDKGGADQRLSLSCWNMIRRIRTMLLEECGLEYDENFWLNSKF